MSKTGGGRGTNQYGVRGVSQASQQDTGVLDDLADTIEDNWEDEPRPRLTWVADGLGPIQAKRVQEAIKGLRSEGRTHVRLTGVVGDPESEHRSTYWSPMYPMRDDVDEAEQDVIRRYGHLTPANHKDVIAALKEATVAARGSAPVVDERITPDEHAERDGAMARRNAEQAAKQQARQAAWDAVVAKAPAGAQAVIVATEQEDASDMMTDYFSSKTLRAVAIGWRFSKRESFEEMRGAAASFEPTANLATPRAERRETYSMGAGNYLGQNPKWGSGWNVKSYPLNTTYPPSTPVEDHLPAPRAARPGAASASARPGRSGVSISPSSIGRTGVVELRFAQKPDQEVRSRLKASGFRWARSNGCWYGPEGRVPSDLVG